MTLGSNGAKSLNSVARAQRAPLLLVPGTLCDARIFAPLAALLTPHRAQVAQLPAVDSIAAMADHILASAPPLFALAGLSLGGIVGLEIAAKAPERLAGLALLGSNARPVAPDLHTDRRHAAQMGGANLSTYARDTLHPLYAGTKLRNDEALRALVTDMATAGGAETLRQQTEAALSRADSRPRLGAIAVPTAVIGGMDDRLGTPDMQREMAGMIPHATLTLLEGVGHLSPWEAPADVAAALNAWLTQVDRHMETEQHHKEELQ